MNLKNFVNKFDAKLYTIEILKTLKTSKTF